MFSGPTGCTAGGDPGSFVLVEAQPPGRPFAAGSSWYDPAELIGVGLAGRGP